MPGELLFDEDKHQYSINGKIIPSVTQILGAVGLYEYDFVSRKTLRVAAERGRIVHRYIELFENGTLDLSSIDPRLEGYFNAYLKMKIELGMPDPDVCEKRLYCAQFGYAGTLDQIIGGNWIHDHKTGEKSPIHGLQLSGYWLSEHPDIRDVPRRLTCGYYKSNGSYEVVDYKYEPLIWMAVLADYKWRVKNNCIKGAQLAA